MSIEVDWSEWDKACEGNKKIDWAPRGQESFGCFTYKGRRVIYGSDDMTTRYRIIEPWNYETDKDHVEAVEMPGVCIQTEYITIGSGFMDIETYYAWNGANVIKDKPDNMRASLFHDALYQLMNMGELGLEWRKCADQLFRDIYLREATRLAIKAKALVEIKRARKEKRLVYAKNCKLNWFEKWKIKSWGDIIYAGVRIGGRSSINKKEYPGKQIVEV